MIDKVLIEKKLRRIEEFLKEIESINLENLEEFKNDIVKKRFIERNLELSIEQMIDICKHFISALDLKEPETYSECIKILAKAGIISEESMPTFVSMVRFRNILIHAYDGIDDSITYGIYKKHLNDFREFITQIRNYLKNKPSPPQTP